MSVLGIFVICTFLVSVYGSDTPLIINGHDAPNGKYPYIVYLSRSGAYQCSGTILDERNILTSADCLVGLHGFESAARIHVGTTELLNSGTTYKVEKVVPHETHIGALNNIGIIHLKKSIKFNDQVKPVILAEKNSNYDLQYGYVAGWGSTNLIDLTTNKLQELQVRIIPALDCAAVLKGFQPQHLCTYVQRGGFCLGDGGAPLVVNDVQIGIATFAVPCAQGVPDGYANIAYFREWIDSHKSGASLPMLCTIVLLLPLINLFM